MCARAHVSSCSGTSASTHLHSGPCAYAPCSWVTRPDLPESLSSARSGGRPQPLPVPGGQFEALPAEQALAVPFQNSTLLFVAAPAERPTAIPQPAAGAGLFLDTITPKICAEQTPSHAGGCRFLQPPRSFVQKQERPPFFLNVSDSNNNMPFSLNSFQVSGAHSYLLIAIIVVPNSV